MHIRLLQQTVIARMLRPQNTYLVVVLQDAINGDDTDRAESLSLTILCGMMRDATRNETPDDTENITPFGPLLWDLGGRPHLAPPPSLHMHAQSIARPRNVSNSILSLCLLYPLHVLPRTSSISTITVSTLSTLPSQIPALGSPHHG